MNESDAEQSAQEAPAVPQPKRPLYTDCPTPKKSRFATMEAAEIAVTRASFELSKTLYTYDTCPCGWIHLTSKKSRVSGVPSLTGLGAYDRETFARVVRDDVRKIVHPDDAAALRHPENLQRWRGELKNFRLDIHAQLAAKASARDKDTAEWRKRTEVVGFSIASAINECQTLIEKLCVENREKRKKEKSERHEAGERAIQRLVEAHQDEFNSYLVEECAVLGVEVPLRVRRHIERRQMEKEKETWA